MEKLEGEVDKFVMQKDFDGLNFPEFRKALLGIESRLAEFESSLDASVSDCYYETQRLREQLEELRPQTKKMEEVLETTKEIKLPFKFESTLNTFTVRLLDLNFVEVLSETLHGKPHIPELPKKHTLDALSPNKLAVFDRVMGDEEVLTDRRNSVKSITERFNSTSMARKTILPRLTITTADSHSDPYDLRRSMAAGSSRKITLDSARRAEEPLMTASDVQLNTCENVYDLSRRVGTPGYKSFKMPPSQVRTESAGISDFGEDPLSTPRAKIVGGTGSGAPPLMKKSSLNLNRKSTLGEYRKFPKYYSSVITLNEDCGVICNQVVDEFKFRTILASLKAVPRNVRMIEMVNNVFKINPVPMLKAAFEAKLGYVLQIDIPRNQMLANLVYTKRDLELLANLNIVLLN